MNNRLKITTINFLKYGRILSFLMLAFIVLFFLVIGLRKLDLSFNPNAKNHYLATIIDKMNLVDSIKTPRLILMGGNGMAFGVDSELLSIELEIPVINLALDSQLGSNFMVNQLKDCAKKGDIMVITLDYNITSEGDNQTKLLVSDFYKPANQWIEFQSFFEPITTIISKVFMDKNLVFNSLRKNSKQYIQDTTSLLFRGAFNTKGDLVSHLNNPNINFTPAELSKSVDFNKQITDLNELDFFAKKHGISIFFTFTSYSESGFEKNMTVVQQIEKTLHQKAKFTILGNAHNAVLDNTFFFNNEYNLNLEGRKIFTSRLLLLLEQENI